MSNINKFKSSNKYLKYISKMQKISLKESALFKWVWKGGSYDYFILTSHDNVYGLLFPGEMDKGSVKKSFHSLFYIGVMKNEEIKMEGTSSVFKVFSVSDQATICTVNDNIIEFNDGGQFSINKKMDNKRYFHNFFKVPHGYIEISDKNKQIILKSELDTYNPALEVLKGIDNSHSQFLVFICMYIIIKKREEEFIYIPA